MIKIFSVFLCFVLLSSCVVNTHRKSEDFYFDNEDKIKKLVADYEKLYAIQPFEFGFSDKRFKYYTIQMYTDSIRYIYNTETGSDLIFEEMRQSKLNREDLTSIAMQIKDLRCLWIGKSDLYLDGKKTVSTNLSFRSVMFSTPFSENKYYILAFFDGEIPNSKAKRRLRKYSYRSIDDDVFFTISTRFR